MKRSHAIVLGATGVILAGAWLGSGGSSSDSKEAAIYNDVDECIRAGVLSGDTCREQFNEASNKHLERAPKFASQSACETEYGASQCKPATFNGAAVFVPAMIGFLVANHLAGNRQAQALMPPLRRASPCPPGQTPETMPGCYAPRPPGSSSSSGSSSSFSSGSSRSWNSYSTAGGDTVSRRSDAPGGIAKVPSSAAAAPAARSALGAVSPRSSSVSSSSSSTTSRGGFGSTGRSVSSSSS
ncbi:MAG: DUF1190 domain-containing protein [Hyphomicrobiales bacterium]|nr:DUF1190 domain-containing protein [Hyphomicrobiales bacterium]